MFFCRLFQVTWLTKTGFIYDRNNLSKVCALPFLFQVCVHIIYACIAVIILSDYSSPVIISDPSMAFLRCFSEISFCLCTLHPLANMVQCCLTLWILKTLLFFVIYIIFKWFDLCDKLMLASYNCVQLPTHRIALSTGW